MLSDTPPARATSHSPSRSIWAPWINPALPGGTGGADRVMRPGDAHVERDFAGRVVGHGARIVVVRPEFRVVIEPFELKDFVLGLDVAVLGDADVNADHRFVDVGPIQPGIGDRLAGTVNADAAGPRAAADLFFLLVLQLVEVADAGHGRSDVANFVTPYATSTCEQILAEIRADCWPPARSARPR